VTAIKSELRANLLAARSGITTADSANSTTTITVNSASFSDSMFVRIRCTSSSPITVTLANDVPAGRALELVQYSTGAVTAVAGSGATLVKVSSASASTTNQYEPIVFEVDTNTGVNAAWRLVARS
jgi:hypothetical protein